MSNVLSFITDREAPPSCAHQPAYEYEHTFSLLFCAHHWMPIFKQLDKERQIDSAFHETSLVGVTEGFPTS